MSTTVFPQVPQSRYPAGALAFVAEQVLGAGLLARSVLAVDVGDQATSIAAATEETVAKARSRSKVSRSAGAQDRPGGRLALRSKGREASRRDIDCRVAGHVELLSNEREKARLLPREAKAMRRVVDVIEVADGRLAP